MISAECLIWIIPAAVVFGLLIGALCAAAKDNKGE